MDHDYGTFGEYVTPTTMNAATLSVTATTPVSDNGEDPTDPDTAADVGLPSNWAVTRIEGDLIAVNQISQYSFVTDDDCCEDRSCDDRHHCLIMLTNIKQAQQTNTATGTDNNHWVLVFRNPHLLEGAELRKHRATEPSGEITVWRGADADLDIFGPKLLQLTQKPVPRPVSKDSAEKQKPSA